MLVTMLIIQVLLICCIYNTSTANNISADVVDVKSLSRKEWFHHQKELLSKVNKAC